MMGLETCSGGQRSEQFEAKVDSIYLFVFLSLSLSFF